MATFLHGNYVSDLFTSGGTLTVLLCMTHIVIGSIFFDVVHWLAHKSHRSPYRILRLLARTHHAHHQFFDRQLRFNDKFSQNNKYSHLLLEVVCQTLGTTLSWAVVYLFNRQASTVENHHLFLLLALQAIRCLVVVWNEGRDSNHISYSRLPKDPNFFFVGPEYHTLHHLEPNNYFGSMVRIFDWITGTAVSLKGRRVALTGSRGAFGKALQKELRQAKVKNIKPLVFGVDWTYEDYGQLAAIFQDIDVLIIAHGTKVDKDAWQANYLSVLTLIELFKQTRESNKLGLMPEVWFVGSEAEVHGAWTSDMVSYVNTKRAVVPYCRGFYEDDTFIYRHIVPAAFQSSMGSALVSAEWAARSTLWWIHRGARYVPVTYTGLAFINFFRFLYWVTPKIIRTGAGDKVRILSETETVVHANVTKALRCKIQEHKSCCKYDTPQYFHFN